MRYKLLLILILLNPILVLGKFNMLLNNEFKTTPQSQSNSSLKPNDAYQQLQEMINAGCDSCLEPALEILDQVLESGDSGLISKTYQQIGLLYQGQYNYAEAIKYFNNAIDAAKLVGDLKLEAEVLGNLALSLQRIEKEQEGISKSKQALQIYLQLEDQENMAWTLFNLGVDFKQLGYSDSAKNYLGRAKILAESMNIQPLKIRVFNILGNILSDEGELAKALEYYQRALVPAEETQFERAMTALYTNIAIIHKDLEDYDKAIEYYLKSMKIDLKNKFDRIHLVQYNLGVLYTERKQYDQALKYLRQSLKIREEIGLLEKQLVAALMIAEVHNKLNNPDSTKFYADYGEQLISRVQNPREKAFGYEQLAEINLSEGNFALAEIQYLEAHRLYSQIGNLEYISFSAQSLYELYKAMGDDVQSLKFLEKHIQTKDSLINKERIREVTKLEEGYKHEKQILEKQNEIALLQSKEEIANLRISILVIIITIITIFGFIIARYLLLRKERKKRQLEEMALFKEAMTGMIAHDLKNPLGIILGTESEKPSTRQMARQMLNLVNNMLDVHKFESTKVLLDPVAVPLSGLVMEAIEQVRPLLSGKNVSIKSLVSNTLMVNVDHEYLLRVFVNLFTNAIKYSPNNGSIEVETSLSTNGKVEVLVKDQGVGIAEKDINKIFEHFGQVAPRKSGGVGSTGLGLSFSQLALRAHGSELEVNSEVGIGTVFSFQLEVSTDANRSVAPGEEEFQFRISKQERAMIIAKIPKLRALKIHQAFAIEEVLEGLDEYSTSISGWSEQVINAAYNNNRAHYDELLDMIDNSN